MGPLVLLGATIVFAAGVFGAAVFKTFRENAAASHRGALIDAASQTDDDEKGFLDHGAELEQAVAELNIAMPMLGQTIKRIGKRASSEAAKNTALIKRGASFADRRSRVMKAARAFERQCDELEPRIRRLEKASGLLKESFPSLVAHISDRAVLEEVDRNANVLLNAIPFAEQSTASFRDSLQGLRKQNIQLHLNRSVVRMRWLVERSLAAITETKRTCEGVIHSVKEKCANKPVLSDSAIELVAKHNDVLDRPKARR
jgi:hypothetical protein